MANPYYQPEKFNFEELFYVDHADSYQFDTFIVWKRTTDNTLWYAQDSGCSCPTPFDDVEPEQITTDSFYSFYNDLKHHCGITHEETQEIQLYVRSHLKKFEQ